MASEQHAVLAAFVREAFAEHLRRLANDDEGVRVDLGDDLLEKKQLPASDDRHYDALFLACVAALAVEQCRAAVELF